MSETFPATLPYSPDVLEEKLVPPEASQNEPSMDRLESAGSSQELNTKENAMEVA